MILDPTSRDEEGKKSIYVIIGVCCGVFLLILVVHDSLLQATIKTW